jgi:hypothetical protein
MLKTALSATLVAFALLAPVASAAPEPKPQPVKEPKAAVLDEKAAKYCAEIAAIKPDKKGVITLTKEQLAFQSTFDCPVERPQDCPPAEKQKKYDETVKAYVGIGSDKPAAQMPEWLQQAYRPECSLDTPSNTEPELEQPFDPSVIGSDKLRP